ncbi:hypothetical protein Syun_007059 [Stephania yunnanensis]|uniref:Uncharacterized protein n=1 Tax=Stephania yunnanensis TaxID=152371 RepID=A0AAP0PYA1_9MAGN
MEKSFHTAINPVSTLNLYDIDNTNKEWSITKVHNQRFRISPILAMLACIEEHRPRPWRRKCWIDGACLPSCL